MDVMGTLYRDYLLLTNPIAYVNVGFDDASRETRGRRRLVSLTRSIRIAHEDEGGPVGGVRERPVARWQRRRLLFRRPENKWIGVEQIAAQSS